MSDDAASNEALAQTRAFNRLAQSVEGIAKSLKTIATALTSSKETVENGITAIADAATKVAETTTSIDGTWSKMLIETTLIQKSLAKTSSKYSHVNATSPHAHGIDLSTRAGQYAWVHGTTLPSHMEEWGKLEMGPSARKKFRELGDWLKENGFGDLLSIPTKGSGKPKSSPHKTSVGTEVADVELSDPISAPTNSQACEREDVLKWVACFNGAVGDGLTVPTDRIQKLLDFGATGNSGNDALVADKFHQYRIRSEMLMVIIRKLFESSAIESLDANKDLFTWKREYDDIEFSDGLTVYWLILEMIEPKTVIDSGELEKVLQNTTLIGDYKGNVRAYLALMKKTLDELHQRHGKQSFSKQKYLELIFNQLMTVEQKVWDLHVTGQYSAWSANTGAFKEEEFFKGIDNLFTSLSTAEKWDVKVPEDPKLIALAAKNLKLQKKVDKFQKEAAAAKKKDSDPSGGSVDEKWREKYAGPTKICPHGDEEGDTYFWCKDHRHKKGMYMPSNVESGETPKHDHAKWQAKKDLYREKREKKRKSTGDDSSAASTTSSTPKLKVNRDSSRKSKRQKKVEFLVAQHGMDHHAAVKLAGQLSDCSSDEESKD